MQTAAFYAKCPYEIGDKIQVVKEVKAGGRVLKIAGPAKITDIACTHYLKDGEILFTYELDGSGKYIPLVTERDWPGGNVGGNPKTMPGARRKNI